MTRTKTHGIPDSDLGQAQNSDDVKLENDITNPTLLITA
jgi:hypothetical protein